jgi:hypothetical protein
LLAELKSKLFNLSLAFWESKGLWSKRTRLTKAGYFF